MTHDLVVILNDGTTYSSIDDCKIALVSIDEATGDIYKQHQWILLKDNPNAIGFTMHTEEWFNPIVIDP